MADNAPQQDQIEISKRLQLLWLQHMEKLFTSGEITSTDLATLSRFLMANGWTLDVTRLPEGLKNKLTSGMKPDDFENDGDVLSINRKFG